MASAAPASPTFQRWSQTRGVGGGGAPGWPDSDLQAWAPPGEASQAALALPRGGTPPSSGPAAPCTRGPPEDGHPHFPTQRPCTKRVAGRAAEGCSQQRASVGTDSGFPLSNVHVTKKLDGIFKDVFLTPEYG